METTNQSIESAVDALMAPVESEAADVESPETEMAEVEETEVEVEEAELESDDDAEYAEDMMIRTKRKPIIVGLIHSLSKLMVRLLM